MICLLYTSIRVFFHFLMECNPVYKNYDISDFTTADLERIEPVDIEEYQEYLKVYKNEDEKQITNTEKGLSRKMSALRSFYGYFFKRQIITKNPTLLVDMPKLHEKAIIRLDTDEVASLLDFVEHGGDMLTLSLIHILCGGIGLKQSRYRHYSLNTSIRQIPIFPKDMDRKTGLC